MERVTLLLQVRLLNAACKKERAHVSLLLMWAVREKNSNFNLSEDRLLKEYTKREKTLTLLFGFAFRGMLLECQGCMNEQEGRLLMIEYMDLVRQARRKRLKTFRQTGKTKTLTEAKETQTPREEDVRYTTSDVYSSSSEYCYENWFIQMGMHGFGRGNNNASSSERNNSNRKKRKMSGYNNVAKSDIDFVDGLEQSAATTLSSFN
ncbi:hypothetical protein Tco_1078611 [Tanacetum coccineum]|uniref:Uncharacterized protein n=1 Tax=Tanacetum coccineum TaxID=301880 RepID=A0ABQ5HPG7_9ASTR